MTNPIAPSSALQRENARRADGKFGHQAASEADVDLSAGAPASWAQARVADLTEFRDDVNVRENPAAAPALQRVSVLAASFKDRPDTEAVQNAVNATVAEHDVPGGLLEGFAADNGNCHVGFLKQVGHRGRVLAAKQPWDSSTEPPVASEKYAVLAALSEERLRTERPYPSVVDPQQVRAVVSWEDGDLDAEEVDEITGRLARLHLSPADQLNEQNALDVIDSTRQASRGMSLTQLRENRFGADDAASVAAEALGENAAKSTQFQRTPEGDSTGAIIFMTPAGNTVAYNGGFLSHGGQAYWHSGSPRARRLAELPEIVAKIDRGED